EYDGAGRLTRITDDHDPLDPTDDRGVEWSWDSLSFPIRETQNGVAVERRFDGVGNLLATVYPGGGPVLEASYDALDRCETLTLASDERSTLLCRTEYAGPGSRLVLEELGNGLETRYDYDGRRRLLSLETRSPATTISGRIYAYDRGDNRVSERWLERGAGAGHEGRAYEVDSLGRFVAAEPVVLDAGGGVIGPGDFGESLRWLLDGAGNWVRYETAAATREASFDALNQDTDDEHDAGGNRAADDGRRYVVDALNRLIAVLAADGGAARERYAYDGTGRRTTRTVVAGDGSSSTTDFLHAGDHVIEERTGGELSARNYQAPTGIDYLVARDDPENGLRWLHRDVVMSTTALTDEAGQVVERCEYQPFGTPRFLDADLRPVLDGDGQPLQESAAGNPYLFTGRHLDGTGLYYFRQRYLDAERGRFLSRDPRRDPINTGNLFSYAGLNPLVYNDPWGTAGEWRFEWSWSKAGNMLKNLGLGVVDKIRETHDAASNALAWGIWNSPVAVSIRAATNPEYTRDEIIRDLKSAGQMVAGVGSALNNWIELHRRAVKADAALSDEEWMRTRAAGIVIGGAGAAIALETMLAAEVAAAARVASTVDKVADAADAGADLARTQRGTRAASSAGDIEDLATTARMPGPDFHDAPTGRIPGPQGPG
ncbi:MAG: RHS repeat-associated core domain-containing protein, partial [Chloroflexi bacterium]|nr:RHS repeat-associated core domain-containing protein [Chloroflexota bacterium]